jgi:hypothetical protein
VQHLADCLFFHSPDRADFFDPGVTPSKLGYISNMQVEVVIGKSISTVIGTHSRAFNNDYSNRLFHICPGQNFFKDLVDHLVFFSSFWILLLVEDTFFTRLYPRVFRPSLAAMVVEQPWPSDLAEAINKVVKLIQTWTDEAFLGPIMRAAQICSVC